MRNLTYERASHYIELKAHQSTMENVTMIDIGNYDFLSQPDWWMIRALPRKFRPTTGANSLIKVKLFKFFQSGQ